METCSEEDHRCICAGWRIRGPDSSFCEASHPSILHLQFPLATITRPRMLVSPWNSTVLLSTRGLHRYVSPCNFTVLLSTQGVKPGQYRETHLKEGLDGSEVVKLGTSKKKNQKFWHWALFRHKSWCCYLKQKIAHGSEKVWNQESNRAMAPICLVLSLLKDCWAVWAAFRWISRHWDLGIRQHVEGPCRVRGDWRRLGFLSQHHRCRWA